MLPENGEMKSTDRSRDIKKGVSKMQAVHESLDRGWNLIPVGKDKKPLIKWKKYQTTRTTHNQIDRWAEQFPGCSWGLVCGAVSGSLHVVDFDDPEVYESFLKEKLEKNTLIVKTPSGGYHAYFEIKPCPPNITDYKELYNIDTRGEGGYVLAPEISEGYTIISDTDVMQISEEELRDTIDVWQTITDDELFDYDAIKADVTLPDVVRHYGDGDVSEVRSKNDYKLIVCPFHNDHAPSCAIHLHYFKCHGCGKKGSVIDYVMYRQNIDKPLTAAMAIERMVNRQYRKIQTGTGGSGNVDIPIPDASELNGDWIDEKISLDLTRINGFISEYIEYASKRTDAYKEYHYAGALMILSTMTGRKRWIFLKQTILYGNLFQFILGPSTISRKSVAMDIAEEILTHIMGSWDYLAQTFSPEAFTEQMAEISHRVLIVDEAGQLLANMKKKYMDEAKDLLCKAYDCKGWNRVLTKKKNDNGTRNVVDPYLTIAFATVPDNLLNNCTQDDVNSGWLARFLYFIPKYQKEMLPFELGADRLVAERASIHKKASEINEWLMNTPPQPMEFEKGAFEMFQEWQTKHEESLMEKNDNTNNMVMGRLFPITLKVAMLHAIGRMCNTITKDDIIESMREVDNFFAITSANIIRDVETADRTDIVSRKMSTVERYLKNHGGKANRRELLNATKTKVKEFAEIIQAMVTSGAIREIVGENKGKNTTVMYCLQKSS